MPSAPFHAASFALFLALAGNSPAITDPDNLGQWDKPTNIGPDKDCPGFLVNLGPTGARAILKETSFVVKQVFPGSPADGLLHIDDEITGANGKAFSKHTFGKFYGMDPGAGYEGPIMDLGNAIEDSEGKDGTLSLDVIRSGQPAKVEVKLEAIGRFSDTFPKNCPKSEKLTARAMDYLLNRPEERCGIVHEKGMLGLAMLAQGKTDEAETLAMAWNVPPGEKEWTWYPSYQAIFLSEYFLQTGDKRVLPTIEENCKRLYLSQVIDPELYKDSMHGGQPQAQNFLKGGNALAWGWALLGVQQSGNEAAAREVFDYNKAFINMARTHDGAFVIQPGRNLHEKAYYMSPRIHPTAAMVLALGKEKGRLRIQGNLGKAES